jgi:hypothetical protein
MGYTTWLEIFGNGVGIGMGHRMLVELIHTGLELELGLVFHGYYAAAVGTI